MVAGREKEQVVALGQQVVETLALFPSTSIDDEKTLVELRGAGQTPKKLTNFAVATRALARAFNGAARAIPPPAAMAEALEGWQKLAARLSAPLETSRMAVDGQLDGIPASVVTEWSAEGTAERTLLTLRPPVDIDGEVMIHVTAGQEPTGLPEGVPRELMDQITEGCYSFDLSAQEVRLSLRAPILDPAPLIGRLADMARLVMALRPGAGPFR